jgi:hypothetical protein
MQCLIYDYSSTDTDGNSLLVHRVVSTPNEECGRSNVSESILLNSVEYTELQTLAYQTNVLDQAIEVISPADVAAVYGTSFALIFSLGAVAYKVKVGKNLIKLL